MKKKLKTVNIGDTPSQKRQNYSSNYHWRYLKRKDKLSLLKKKPKEKLNLLKKKGRSTGKKWINKEQSERLKLLKKGKSNIGMNKINSLKWKKFKRSRT